MGKINTNLGLSDEDIRPESDFGHKIRSELTSVDVMVSGPKSGIPIYGNSQSRRPPSVSLFA